MHHFTLEVWKLSVLWYSSQILSAAYHQRQKYSCYDWKVCGVNTGSGVKMQRYSLLCQPSTGKRNCSLCSVSPGLKTQLYWKGHFLSFRVFEQLLIHLQSLAEVKGGEDGAGSPQGVLGTPTQGKVPLCESDLKPTQVPSLLLHEPLLFCLMVWHETFCLVQFRCLRMRPIIFYKILSEISWKERKCGISSLCRMYVLGCCHLPPGQF